jgi:hypothetical protein
MYIFDKLWEWIFPPKLDDEFNYDPLNEFEDDDADCEHDFRPIDSTGKILACIKCGFIVKLKDNDIKKD